MPEFDKEQMGSPHAYLQAAAAVQNAVMSGKCKPVDGTRILDMLQANCESFTGRLLKDVARDEIDPIERFVGKMEDTEPELLAVIESLQALDETRMSEEQKKKHISTLRTMIAVIQECRDDAAKFCIYVGRDAKTGEVLHLEAFHDEFCRVWDDTHVPHSLIEAAPGHGKSSLLYLFIALEMGRDPSLRSLYITDAGRKAIDAIAVVRRIIKSGRFHSLFPGVFVLGRVEGRKSTAEQFSVNGIRDPSRDASLTAAGIVGNINGSGFDRIYGDDFMPPTVADVESERVRVNRKWFKVVVKRLRDHRDARVRIIHTPWHDGDTCGIILRDINEGRRPNWQASLHPILDDAQGKAIPLWPERFPRSFLEGEKLQPGYNPLYRLKTASSSEILVPSVHFYHSIMGSPLTRDQDKELAEKLQVGERWLSVDPAATGGAKSSYSGIVEFILGNNGFVFITNCWFLHCEPVGLQAWILERLFNATGAGYAGLHMEGQAAMKYGHNLIEYGIREGLKTGNIPIKDDATGKWGTYKHPKHYQRHLEILNTDTRFGGATSANNNLGKRQRLKMAAAVLSTPIVKFAGQRKENHTLPRSHPAHWYCGAISGSDIERLVSHIVNFDSNTITDGVDAVTQWLIVNMARLASYNWETKEAIEKDESVQTLADLAKKDILSMPKDPDPEEEMQAEDCVLDSTLGEELWN